MEYKLENLDSIVKLSASDDFIKKIIRSYLTIDPQNFKKSSELYELIYNQMRVDPNSIGKINENDRMALSNEVQKDVLAWNPNANNPLKEQLGFFTFKSWHILGGQKIPDNEMRHRIYINSKAENLMALTKEIYEELKQKGIPFYFKIQGKMNDEYLAEKGFKDSFVLYTSTPLLDETIKTLLEVEKKHPELIQNCNEPSELVGKINKWLGYASETEIVKHSYTSNVCIGMANAIERSVQEWCQSHGEVKIGNSTIKEYYDNMMWDEMKTKTQALVSNIPKVDSTFVVKLCSIAREEFAKVGLNPDNLCMTNIAKKEIESKVEVSKNNREISQNNVINYSKSQVKGFDKRSPQEIVIAEQIKLKNLNIQKQKELERINSRTLVRVRTKNGTFDSNGFANALIITILTIIIAIFVAVKTICFLK